MLLQGTTLTVLLVASLGCFAGVGDDELNPFGVGSSAEASGRYGSWLPKMAAAGAKWVRLFPDWNQIEPAEGKWDWSLLDGMLAAAASNHVHITGLFLYNAKWVNPNSHTFPTNYPAWSEYVSNVVRHAAGGVRYYEVWNEPESFASESTPADYARVVTSAYDAAKAVSPDAQIALSVASVDVLYLERAIRAGAAGHYDYICVHPYEVLGTVATGQEALYMSIVPTLREMLAAVDPPKRNVPIWFTEIGEEAGKNATLERQAQDLVKAYVMGIAQGVSHIQWFEAQEGGYSMGLLDGKGEPRAAYHALKNLAQALGPRPFFKGWVLLDGRDYGFVFQGADGPVLVAWARPGTTHELKFEPPVKVIEPLNGSHIQVNVLSLSNAPLIVLNVPAGLISEAEANKDKPFPWGGDYSRAEVASISMGNPNIERGLHQLNADVSSKPVVVNGGPARDCSIGSGVAFTVDPNFVSYTHTAMQISAVVRSISTNEHPGFNLKYESAGGRKGIGWNFVPGADRWYTLTWTLNDDEFVGNWGYHFSFDSDSKEHSKYYLQSVTVTKVVPPGEKH